VLLVVLVIYCFLRSARATLIPAAAIPVSVIGSFMVLYLLGFTINTLTLMGITLAIGLVVDDAIVVVENITRWMEDGAGPVEAARRGMEEISFAVISATISAVAVFLPLTFLTDTTGRLFREFAVTVAAAVAVSGFVALTLSPALCALAVRHDASPSPLKVALAGVFDAPGRFYARIIGPALRAPSVWIAIGVAWVLLGGLLLRGIDQELIPTSDRGSVIARLTAPEGATIEYTDRYQREAERVFLRTPEIERLFSVVSLGIGTPGLVNEGFMFTMLSPEDERERHQRDVVEALNDELRDVAGVQAFAFEPRPLGQFSAAPVSLVIQGQDLQELARLADAMKRELDSRPGFSRVETDLFLNKPQLDVHIDRDRASDLGVSVREVARTLQILLGGQDLSTFKLEGETYDVIVQLEPRARARVRQLMDLYVRGHDGALIPLRSVVDARETIAPRALPHYDRFRAVTVSARLDPGFAQKEALDVAASVASEVISRDEGYNFVWTGDAEKFFESGNSLAFAYVFAILVVYLVLSAQFESFVHPITILVAVALSFTGALLGLKLVSGWRELVGNENPMTLNIYSKIGLVMLVGLVTKNSILIVEFANQLRDRGMAVQEATLEACRIRFRPILMTALATIAGLVPIAAGAGAGGESRQPLGVAVVGGVFFATFLSFFVVPAVYLQVERFRERVRGIGRAPASASSPGVAGGR
jgi:multidrug efflux pump